MKKTLKIFILILAVIISINSSFAISVGKVEKAIKNSRTNETSTIAISIRNTDTGDIVFEQNSKKLLHPASVLKLFTTYSALDVLGYDYSFKTGFYLDNENNLYIKLGADPLLTANQIKTAFRNIKEQNIKSFNNLYFDDSITDKKEFPDGWMWDDDVNPYTPKISAYNIDSNTIEINLVKNANGEITAEKNSSFPMSVIAKLKSDEKKDFLEINRYNWNNPEVVELEGNIAKINKIKIPISSMRRYYIYVVDKALEDANININSTQYSSKKVSSDAKLIYEITNPISRVIPQILQNSNNLMAETVFKLAGGVKYNSTASEELAYANFNEFYKKLGTDTKGIIIKDGSGVSRNNLVYADWITETLNKIYKHKDFEKFKENMAQSGEGTLSSRLYDLRGELWLKTGSLANISCIAGYVKSKDGKTYSVAILTQNFTEPQEKIKSLEDEIITLIYNQ